jgi:HPt (histidine-containing phosphotransfer) domain-containing protein
MKVELESELKIKRSIRSTLETTKKFLTNASPDDQESVGKVLSFFGDDDGEGHGPMGMPQDVNKMVRQMIEDMDREIEELKQDLQNQ